MAVQSLTYAELAEVWGVSKDAARKKVEGLRLPRTRGNDGKARVQIDLEEVTHVPKSRPETTAGVQPESDPGDQEEGTRSPHLEVQALQDRVAELRSDLERERAEARVDLDRERAERLVERDRADRLASDLSTLSKEFVRISEEVRDAATFRANLEAAFADLEQVKASHALEMAKAISARQEDAERAKAELDAWRARPWWKRLTG